MIDPDAFARRQMELTAEFAKYVMDHPDVDEALPEDSYVYFEIEGELDYTTYLKRPATLPGDVPLMIEHMQGPAAYDESREHLFALGEKVGLSFG